MATVNYYTVGGRILAEATVGGTYRTYGSDALGSVVAAYVDGLTENTYRYKPYGAQLAKTGTAPDPAFTWVGALGYRRYSGSYTDLYMRARHFSTLTGQWTSVDPLWPDEVAYRYAASNPISTTDGSGMVAQKATSKVSGTASCYDYDFVNCCTHCGICFDPCGSYAAALPGGGTAKWGCGDKVKCCLDANLKKCVTVVIADTGGKGRLIDLPCCFAAKNGFPPLAKVTCWKVGHEKIKRVCWKEGDCAVSAADRGVQCGGKIKKRKIKQIIKN